MHNHPMLQLVHMHSSVLPVMKMGSMKHDSVWCVLTTKAPSPGSVAVLGLQTWPEPCAECLPYWSGIYSVRKAVSVPAVFNTISR